jgi:hypothetical protein
MQMSHWSLEFFESESVRRQTEKQEPGLGLVFCVAPNTTGEPSPGKRWKFSMISVSVTPNLNTNSNSADAEEANQIVVFGGHRLLHGFANENSQENRWESTDTCPEVGCLNDLTFLFLCNAQEWRHLMLDTKKCGRTDNKKDTHPNVEQSDEEDLVPESVPFNDRACQIGENAPRTTMNQMMVPPDRQTSEMIMETEFMSMEDGTTAAEDSSNLMLSRSEPHPEKKTWMIPDSIDQSAVLPSSPKAEENSRASSESTSAPRSPSNMCGSLADAPPGTDSKKRRRFFRTLRRKNGPKFDEGRALSLSREEPLISHPSNQMLDAPAEREGVLRNRMRAAQSAGPSFMQEQQDDTCPPSEKTAKRLSKLAGRFGLDFGVCTAKSCHCFVNRTLDEEKDNEMSKTGFVTFLDLGAVTCVASAPLTHKPNALAVTVAPEARDLVWQNCHCSSNLHQRRQSTANDILAIGALVWSVPVAFVQGVSSAENVSQLPR